MACLGGTIGGACVAVSEHHKGNFCFEKLILCGEFFKNKPSVHHKPRFFPTQIIYGLIFTLHFGRSSFLLQSDFLCCRKKKNIRFRGKKNKEPIKITYLVLLLCQYLFKNCFAYATKFILIIPKGRGSFRNGLGIIEWFFSIGT